MRGVLGHPHALCGGVLALTLGCADGAVPDPDPPGDALLTRDPFVAPADPLAGADVEGCAIFEEETCEGGVRRRCEVYDPASASFITPDPMLARVLHFDRWYDLYHQPEGQTAEREIAGGATPGEAETAWGSRFNGWGGLGDSAIWTGVATNAALFRYLSTGTAADRARLERKVRAQLTQFDVTGIPGYLARYHYGAVDPGAPKTDEHVLRSRAEDLSEDLPIRDAGLSAPDLPAIYAEGWTDPQGTNWDVTPMWHGNPSIDQYTGPMVSLPAAIAVLGPGELQDRTVTHLTCYLKRLERLEIRNLQSSDTAREALQGFLAGMGGELVSDGDLDVTALDTIVGYVLPRVHPGTVGDIDPACPATLDPAPKRILDASDDDFTAELLVLAGDVGVPTANAIDHFYIPSVRGGDAVHMLHLAAIGWHFTGEPAYEDLFFELVNEVGALKVANTLGTVKPPTWCRAFYGDHITIPPLWALLNLLDEDTAARAELGRALVEEAWDRVAADLGNAKFSLMIGLHDGDAAKTAAAMTLLADLGGNGGLLDDPRRTYDLRYANVLAESGASARCPTPEEREACEVGPEIFGTSLGGEDITMTCVGYEGQCAPFDDGECALAIADRPLPPHLRSYEDFMWQRNPFKIGYPGGDGGRQSPGLDLTESAWLARSQGVWDAPGVLAWRELGACE